MPVGAVLFSEMTPGHDWEQRFNDWYDKEHIPLRMNAPGFSGAQRYRSADGNGYLAVYDMDDASALETPEYTAIKSQPSDETRWMLGNVTGFTRNIGSLLSWQTRAGVDEVALLEAPYLYAVMFNVPSERHQDFNDWYERDHVPLLLESDDWLGCRRYKLSVSDPIPFTHLAIHHLVSSAALESEARKKARETPWREKLAAEDWFKGHYVTFERLGDRFSGSNGLPK